jgi:hypothetical protein
MLKSTLKSVVTKRVHKSVISQLIETEIGSSKIGHYKAVCHYWI